METSTKTRTKPLTKEILETVRAVIKAAWLTKSKEKECRDFDKEIATKLRDEHQISITVPQVYIQRKKLNLIDHKRKTPKNTKDRTAWVVSWYRSHPNGTGEQADEACRKMFGIGMGSTVLKRARDKARESSGPSGSKIQLSEFYDPQEAAAACGVAKGTIASATSMGKLVPARRVSRGRIPLYLGRDLVAWRASVGKPATDLSKVSNEDLLRELRSRMKGSAK